MERHSLTVLYGRAGMSEVSRRTNLTPRAIRLYEQRGLVEAGRDEVGARCFSPEMVERLVFIALSRRAGLSLKDIGELISLSRSRGAVERALELCERRLADLDREREGVRQMVAAMRPEAPRKRATAGARSASL